MPSAAALRPRDIRRALGPALVDVVRGLETDCDALKHDQSRLILPTLRQQEAATARLVAEVTAVARRTAALEAWSVLPGGLSFWQRLRWLVLGV